MRSAFPLTFIVGFYFCFASHADGSPLRDARELARSVVSNIAPLSFAPIQLKAEDFAIEVPAGAPLRTEIILKSLEWVRVSDVTQIPRLRVRIMVTDPNLRATLTHAGLTSIAGQATLVSPIAPIVVMLTSANGQSQAYTLKWRARWSGVKVGVDTSCSPQKLNASVTSPAGVPGTGSWAHVGCRLIYSLEGSRYRPVLELSMLWANRGDNPIRVNGGAISESAAQSPLLILKTGPESPQRLELASARDKLNLEYRLPARLRLLSFGAGLGPYRTLSRFGNIPTERHDWLLLLTIYGSYFISDITRLVYFNALPLGGRFFSDMGLYLSQEAYRAMDARVRVNLLLGGNLRILAVPNAGTVTRLGVPQGVELIFKDALGRDLQASLGAFIYPEISGKSYSNVWIRYGRAPWFIEFNYLAWKESLPSGPQLSRSAGVSLGFPLFRLL